LYPFSKGEPKALIDVAGKPMAQWVLDALGESHNIDRVVIIGVTAKMGLTCKKPLYHLPNEGRMLANIEAGTAKVLELNPRAQYILFATSDIPGVTGAMIDWVVNTALQTKHDLYYTVIPRQVMEERFPTSRRTFVQMKDLEACGGDMHVVRASLVGKNSDFWEKLIDARKNPGAQASMLGPDIILRFIFRQLTADDVIRRVAERLGLKGRALLSPFAELGMDVDKPHQLEIMRASLGRRQKLVSQGARGRTRAPVAGTRAPTKRAARSSRRSSAVGQRRK
jgi:GTP:adenosylcobinamide-phosphate guanylyltransferase